MLTESEVRKIAYLSKLKLTDAEIKEYQKQISEILEYVDQLKKVDVDGVKPTSHVQADLRNIFRTNKNLPQTLSIEEVLKNVTRKEGRYVVTDSVF